MIALMEKRRYHRLGPDAPEQIRRARERGFSYADIAYIFGCSTSRAQQICLGYVSGLNAQGNWTAVKPKTEEG